MNRFFLATVALIGLTTIGAAEEKKVALSGSNTTIEFVGTKKDGKHTGGFKTVTGTCSMDASDLTTTKIAVTIDTTSLFSDDEKLTAHLKAPDFFSVKKFPDAKFVSKKVMKDGDKYVIVGDLTMLGKTGEVELAATITATGLSGTGVIERSKWGMTYGTGKIDEAVSLTFKVDATK